MSRPQKIIPPVKGTFQEIIDAVAAGKGVRLIRSKPRPKNLEQPASPKKPK